jgi:hypothetical protein
MKLKLILHPILERLESLPFYLCSEGLLVLAKSSHWMVFYDLKSRDLHSDTGLDDESCTSTVTSAELHSDDSDLSR